MDRDAAALFAMRQKANELEERGEHDAAARKLLELGDALCLIQNYDAGLPVLDEARDEATRGGSAATRSLVDERRAQRWLDALGDP